MFNSTTDVYATKRETVHFPTSLVPEKNRVESKFVTQAIDNLAEKATFVNDPCIWAWGNTYDVGNE